MKTEIEKITRDAAQGARLKANEFSGMYANEDLTKQVLQYFEAFVLGHLEPDVGINQAVATVRERARTLQGALRGFQDPQSAKPQREALIKAVDDLENTVLGSGIANGKADALGYGVAGQRIADD